MNGRKTTRGKKNIISSPIKMKTETFVHNSVYYLVYNLKGKLTNKQTHFQNSLQIIHCTF